jgi:serine/threonine protein kinase
MNTTIKKVSLCGSGAYGKVYKVNVSTETSEGKSVSVENAYKRNIIEGSSGVIGAKSIAELSYLSALRNHPFITQLNQVCMGDPFTSDNPMTPLSKACGKEDTFGFLMEFIDETIDVYCKRVDQCTPDDILIMAAQMTIGLRYIHSRNITHRDLKPTNILVSNRKEDNGLRVRIADFGISNRLSSATVSTPNTVTVWYRAPEICTRDPDYSTRSDMWSLGCVLYEMITNIPYLYGVPDDNSKAFTEILRKAESIDDYDLINNMITRGNISLGEGANPIERETLYERIRRNRMEFTGDKTGSSFNTFVKVFNSTPGGFSDFVNLIGQLLVIDPSKRISIVDVLKHDAFKGLYSYINKIHKMYSPDPPDLPVIVIINCMERKWMVKFSHRIYNSRKHHNWYTHRNLFHTMDLFQMYMVWCYNPSNKMLLRAGENNFSGRVHSETEVELRFYVIYYLVYKYYVSMSFPVNFSTICPGRLLKGGNLAIASKFEENFIHTIADNNLYRDTVIEMPDNYSHKIKESIIDKLFHGYCKIEEWNGMSARSMYRKILDLDPQGNSKASPNAIVPLPLVEHYSSSRR